MATTTERQGARGVYADDAQRTSAGSFGLVLFLIILGMLFGGLILAAIVLKLDGRAWPASLPHLPWQTWASTVLLIGTSIALAYGVGAQARGKDTVVGTALMIAGVCAVVFTLMQAWAWYAWHVESEALLGDLEAHRLAVMGFWVFTGVHVAHVLGGLVPLGIVGWYAAMRAWTPVRAGFLRHTATYWHFLDVVWIVLVLTMLWLL